MEKIIKNKQIWLATVLHWMIYITALVPLVIFSQFISPFHFGKVVIFRSLVEIMAVFYLILVLKDRSYLPRRNILLTIFALFTLTFGISTLASVNPYLSFWGSLERMGGWWSFAHYLAYFVVLIGVFKNREDWMRLIKLTIFVGVLSAFYGFGQKTNIKFFIGSGERARIFGTIGNAALFAGYQIVVLFLALSLAFSSWVKTKHRGYFLTAALINTVAILMTAVRGSILGVGVGFLLFAFLYTVTSHSKMAKRILLSLIGLAVIFVGFAFAFKNSDFVRKSGYLTRLTDFSFQTLTVQTRFWAWRAGLTGWVETPKTVLLGWGPENFNVPFSKHFNPKFFRGVGSETLFDRAHNQFIEILVTMGAIAFLVYVSLFVAAIYLLWKKIIRGPPVLLEAGRPKVAVAPPVAGRLLTGPGSEKTIGIGLISLIVAYMIHNSFIFDTSANFLVFFTVLGFISWLTAGDETNSKSEIKNSKLSVGQQTLMILLLIGAAFLIYRTNILPSKANYATTRAIVRSWAGDFDGALAKYKEALSYNVPGKYEYRHRYAQWILERANGNFGKKELEAIIYAIQEVQKNVDETRQDYLPYLYISRAYIILGKSDPNSPYNDKALENSMKALEISPSFIRTQYEIAQAYLNKRDYENTVKYFKKAVDLNPGVGLSHWYLGAVLIEKGEVEKGLASVDRAVELGYGFNEPDALRLINLYIATNNIEKITSLFEQLVALKPDNAQYRASLAAGYAKLGEIDKAVEQARAAARINKEFEAEARAFVKSLGRSWEN